jgi:hypothetical protein
MGGVDCRAQPGDPRELCPESPPAPGDVLHLPAMTPISAIAAMSPARECLAMNLT